MSLIMRAHVATAAKEIAPTWPLESFIAANPLAGSESRPFEAAAVAGVAMTRTRAEYLADYARGRITDADLEAAITERIPELDRTVTVGGAMLPAARLAAIDMTLAQWERSPAEAPATGWLDDYLATWVSTYLNPDALWSMPHRELGFFASWRALARRDPALPRTARRGLASVPLDTGLALSWALGHLGITPDAVPDTLRSELRHLPGWVGHIKWRAEKRGDIDLTSYLAVRFAVRALTGIPPRVAAGTGSAVTGHDAWGRAEGVARALGATPASAVELGMLHRIALAHDVCEHPSTWQKAFERNYRARLVSELAGESDPGERPQLQVLMCIDPRSEGMRRHLEHDPGVETFGFAGFFGIPVRFARYRGQGSIDSLPALLTPRHTLTELPSQPGAARRYIARGRDRGALRRATHVADASAVTPFAFAEATGWLYGATSILRTFAPGAHARLRRGLAPSAATLASTVGLAETFTLDEQVSMAETALRMMGMNRFAPLVVVSGHGSTSANNLYESALDCGACGGNPGAANARSAAAIFNDPAVRQSLSMRGIEIPADTFFVAAEHNTVTDVVAILDAHLVPESHRDERERFDRLQHAAADRLVEERARDLPGASTRHAPKRVRRRATDWAEVYPELGLAGNAAMIIGPRRMSRGVDLGRRVFLHSYETAMDADGSALESIMTAPLVVAQWINHQYYFSALNPTTLGAGTKTIHNAIGTIGVLAGHAGDLRRGLPWQSVGSGTELFHEPLRLTVFIEAPLQRIGGIVSRNQVLRNLLDNDWITLTGRDGPATPWHRYTRYGWTDATTPKGQQP